MLPEERNTFMCKMKINKQSDWNGYHPLGGRCPLSGDYRWQCFSNEGGDGFSQNNVTLKSGYKVWNARRSDHVYNQTTLSLKIISYFKVNAGCCFCKLGNSFTALLDVPQTRHTPIPSHSTCWCFWAHPAGNLIRVPWINTSTKRLGLTGMNMKKYYLLGYDTDVSKERTASIFMVQD